MKPFMIEHDPSLASKGAGQFFLLSDVDVGLGTDHFLRRSEGDDISRHEAQRRGLVAPPIHDQVYGLECMGY